jgi:hypothetical protein
MCGAACSRKRCLIRVSLRVRSALHCARLTLSPPASPCRAGFPCTSEVRDARERKREVQAQGTASGPPGGVGTLPEGGRGNGSSRTVQLNNVPKDEDILGGADGKTFTTHSTCVQRAAACTHALLVAAVRTCSLLTRLSRLCFHLRCCRGRYKTSEMYARIREERGTI